MIDNTFTLISLLDGEIRRFITEEWFNKDVRELCGE